MHTRTWVMLLSTNHCSAYKVLTQLQELIDNSGMPILSAVEFQEAADQVKAKHFLNLIIIYKKS
jgi:hypothetical protein